MELQRSTDPILLARGWADNVITHWSLKLFLGNPNESQNHSLQVLAILFVLRLLIAINIRGVFEYQYAD